MTRRSGSREAPERSLVSVIIPCHDQGRFLGEAIRSAVEQTRPDVEVLVVDDGSTDDTPEVARRFDGVRYVHQENRGLAAARNTGLRNSRGEYLVFLDADDRLLPGAVDAGLRAFDRHPDCAFVSGAHVRVGPDGTRLESPPPERVDRDHYFALLHGNYIGMHAAVMYRRGPLESVGGFDTALPVCEDYELYLRISRQYPVYRHDETVAEYRIHETNVSRNSALMLATCSRILRDEGRRHRGDSRYRTACRDGIRWWRRYYGPLLVESVIDGVRSRGRRAHVVRDGFALLRHAPRWLASFVVRRAGDRMRGRRTGSRRRWPPVGWVRFGSFRRLDPVSDRFGYDRGLPVDRYYIERFLERNCADIRGHVLEIGDATYTRRFGGDRVTRSDVLHAEEGNPEATIVGDLESADGIGTGTFDCIVLTQTLHLIYDVRAAVATLQRILKPGGVLLATFPGVSQIEHGQWADRWCWSFTRLSARRLFEERFPATHLSLETHGNVLAAVAFLEGLAAEELRVRELDHHDEHYPLTIAVRARKPEGESGR